MLPRIATLALRGVATSGAAPQLLGACSALHAPLTLQAALYATSPATSKSAALSPAAAFALSASSASQSLTSRTFATAAEQHHQPSAHPTPQHLQAGAEGTPQPNTQEPPVVLHAGLQKQQHAKEYAFELAYTPSYAESVKPIHRPPVRLHEKLGYWAIKLARNTFDFATGYKTSVPQTEAQWLRRMIFLETVAGVPGMVAGVLRHLSSLRTMKKDHGWIMTMLEEAENERMHLLTFMELRQPGLLFRLMVILAQGVYFNVYFVSYLISPKFCHSLVGYLEEEAVITYTHCINDIDSGKLPWKDKPAPEIGINYWKLPKDAKMRDLIMAIRADEACHSYVNHRLSELKSDADNPFAGSHIGQDPSEKIKDDRKHS